MQQLRTNTFFCCNSNYEDSKLVIFGAPLIPQQALDQVPVLQQITLEWIPMV